MTRITIAIYALCREDEPNGKQCARHDGKRCRCEEVLEILGKRSTRCVGARNCPYYTAPKRKLWNRIKEAWRVLCAGR